MKVTVDSSHVNIWASWIKI